MISYSVTKIIEKLKIDFPEWNIAIDEKHILYAKGVRLPISYVRGETYSKTDLKLIDKFGLELATYIMAYRQIEKHIERITTAST